MLWQNVGLSLTVSISFKLDYHREACRKEADQRNRLIMRNVEVAQHASVSCQFHPHFASACIQIII